MVDSAMPVSCKEAIMGPGIIEAGWRVSVGLRGEPVFHVVNFIEPHGQTLFKSSVVQ